MAGVLTASSFPMQSHRHPTEIPDPHQLRPLPIRGYQHRSSTCKAGWVGDPLRALKPPVAPSRDPHLQADHQQHSLVFRERHQLLVLDHCRPFHSPPRDDASCPSLFPVSAIVPLSSAPCRSLTCRQPSFFSFFSLLTPASESFLTPFVEYTPLISVGWAKRRRPSCV